MDPAGHGCMPREFWESHYGIGPGDTLQGLGLGRTYYLVPCVHVEPAVNPFDPFGVPWSL